MRNDKIILENESNQQLSSIELLRNKNENLEVNNNNLIFRINALEIKYDEQYNENENYKFYKNRNDSKIFELKKSLENNIFDNKNKNTIIEEINNESNKFKNKYNIKSEQLKELEIDKRNIIKNLQTSELKISSLENQLYEKTEILNNLN